MKITVSRTTHLLSIFVLLFITGASFPAFGQAVDTNFNNTGHFTFDRLDTGDFIEDIAIDSKGRTVVAVIFEDPSDDTIGTPTLFRFTAAGLLDVSFGFFGLWQEPAGMPAERNETVALAIDAMDRPVIGYTYFDWSTLSRDWRIRRVTEAGFTDVDFDVSTTSGMGAPYREELTDIAFAPDGKLILAGAVHLSATDIDFMLAMLAPTLNGNFTLDPTFGTRTVFFDIGTTTKIDVPLSLTIQGDLITVAGLATGDLGLTKIAVARLFRSTGNADTTFGSNGTMTYQQQLLGGSPWKHQVARSIVPVPSGGYLMAGSGSETDLSPQHLLALRIASNGGVDIAWGAQGWFSTLVPYPGFFLGQEAEGNDVKVDAYGRALIAGSVPHPNLPQRLGVLVSLSNGGATNLAFSGDGIETYSFEPSGQETATAFNTLALANNGARAMIGGYRKGDTGGIVRPDGDILVTVIYVNGALFLDGFEAGNLDGWSSSSP